MQFSTINDIINEVPKSHYITIQNAARISELVTERTIGPDKPLWQDTTEVLSVDAAADTISKETEKDNLDAKIGDNNTNTILTTPNSLQGLDFLSLNSSILLRDAEQQRRKSIRKQVVIEMEQHHRPILSQNQSETENQQLKKENWFLKVMEEAERQTANEIKEYEAKMKELRRQTESKLVLIAFQGVSQHQKKFRAKYEIVAKLLTSISQQELLSCTEYNNKLKDLIKLFDELLATLRTGVCGPSELKVAENLCISLDDLEASIITELENIIKREQEKAKIYNDEQKKIQDEQQRNSSVTSALPQQDNVLAIQNVPLGTINETSAPSEQPKLTTSIDDQQSMANMQLVSATIQGESLFKSNSQERLEFYNKIISKYHENVEKVKPLQTDANMKTYRTSCQKAINVAVNAITARNPQFIQEKFEYIYKFFAGQILNTADGNISVNDHPLGKDYCILTMAKKFVNQGEQAIYGNPTAAFGFASVVVSLWKCIPEFGEMYLAYTFKESPFLVPYFIPQVGISAEEYYKMCGYRITNGKLESQDKYLKRQIGIARLYAAVIISNGRQIDSNPHPYSLDNAWRWLANIVSMEPLPDICAALLMEMLQTLGSHLLEAFGKQFIKLLFYIQQYYLPNIPDADKCHISRLESLLKEYLTDGIITKPKGFLPQGFW